MNKEVGEIFHLKFMPGTNLPKGLVLNWEHTGPCEVINSKDKDGFTTFKSLSLEDYKVKLAKQKEERKQNGH